MRHGGYMIIDLEGKELTAGTGMTFPGVYEKIEGTNKATLVSGLNVGGTEYNDCFVTLASSGSSFTGTIYGKTITISDADVVTVTE